MQRGLERPARGAQAKKQGIRAQLEDAGSSRSKLANEVKGMKSSITYTTPQQIDELIARLEDRQRHGNLSAGEERRTLAEIEKARGSRKALGEYAARMDKLSSSDAVATSIRDDLRGCDARLAAIKEQEEAARAELAALREGDSESSSGLGELFKERDLLRCALETSAELRAPGGAWRLFPRRPCFFMCKRTRPLQLSSTLSWLQQRAPVCSRAL